MNAIDLSQLKLWYNLCESDNNGNVDVIEFLLDFGANLNARTKWGDTPGHYAACFASFEALKFLIEEGVDMEKETPGKFSNRYIYWSLMKADWCTVTLCINFLF